MRRAVAVLALAPFVVAIPAAISEAGASYAPWEPLHGTITGSPAATSWGPGRLDVFARGPDNALGHKWYAGGWSDWEPLGGVLKGAPTAVSWGPGRLDVFIRGADNALWHKWYAGGWSHWESLGGVLTSDPGATAWGSGRIDVFAAGAGKALWHVPFAGAWGAWESLGGTLQSAPSAASWGVGRIDVFAQGNDAGTWHILYADGWSGWEPLGGATPSAPGVSSWGAGRLDLYVRGTDDQLWNNAYSGGWSGWVPVGGVLTSGPGVASWEPGRSDVFVRGTDAGLWHTYRAPAPPPPPPPPPGPDPVIAAGGDVACSPSDPSFNDLRGTPTSCRMKYTSDLLVRGGYENVLALGDLQYNSGALADFNASYDPTWGREKSITNAVVGNHEYGRTNAGDYATYFGANGGPRAKYWYSYNVGAWHVIVLNSNCTRVGCTNGSEQERWLAADLAASSAQCTIAAFHHARYSTGHDGDNTFMTDLFQDLYDANVDVVLSGHSHDYERFAPQDNDGRRDGSRGITQFVVGTGGNSFTGWLTTDPNSEKRQNTTYGVLELTLHPTTYDWRFIPEAGKTFTDSGTRSCH